MVGGECHLEQVKVGQVGYHGAGQVGEGGLLHAEVPDVGGKLGEVLEPSAVLPRAQSLHTVTVAEVAVTPDFLPDGT